MSEIEYKKRLVDNYFFIESANVERKLIGGIVATDLNNKVVHLAYIHVESDYRRTNHIAKTLHEHMVTWAKGINRSIVQTELVPKSKNDYEITLGFLINLGYECAIKTNDGYQFGFVLQLS